MPTRCCMILLDIYSGKVKLVCVIICQRATLLISTVIELFFLSYEHARLSSTEHHENPRSLYQSVPLIIPFQR